MKTVHSPCTVQHHFWTSLAAARDGLNRTKLQSRIRLASLIIYLPVILICCFPSLLLLLFPSLLPCYLILLILIFSYTIPQLMFLIITLIPIFLALLPYHTLPSLCYFSYLTIITISTKC